MSKYEPVKAGADPRKDTTREGGDLPSMWLRIGKDEAVTGICLVEAKDILSTEQCAIWLEDGNSPVWVYTGPEDPSHDLEVERRYRAYLPLLIDGEPKVWSMGKMAHRALLDIADAVGSLAGVELRIKRTGAMLATRYSIAQTGKRFDVSDIEEIDIIDLLGPITPEGVREMLVKKLNKVSYEDVVSSYRGVAPKGIGAKEKDLKPPKPKATPKYAPKKPKEVAEETDLEEVELL